MTILRIFAPIINNCSNQFYEVPKQHLFDGAGPLCGFADAGWQAKVSKL